MGNIGMGTGKHVHKCSHKYIVSQKVDHQLIAITLSKLNRFSKFFHH